MRQGRIDILRRWRRSGAARIGVVAVVVVAGLVGAGLALGTYRDTRELSVGTVRLFVEPGHRGALDISVPVVDWGLRFDAIRFPARLRVDVRSVDRKAVARVAAGQRLRIAAVRSEARAAIAAYLRWLLAVVFVASLALGMLTALAVRSRAGPRLRWLLATAGLTSAASVVLLLVLLPPRGRIDEPEYHAHGADVPQAMRAVEAATRSGAVLGEELDDQLVGLARLVAAPAGRPPVGGLPRIIVASDLHNNVLALPSLELAAAGRPLFFVGDLTDKGTPFETALTRRLVRAGRPVLFVSGNHDSDTELRLLIRAGAIVLTERGRLLPNGRHGPVVVRVGGLRVAGYGDPFERRKADDYQAVDNPRPTPEEQEAFADWVLELAGKVDVIMVHQPALASLAVERLREQPPARPLLMLMGHTHGQALARSKNLVVLNPGTVGAGGTGNLSEHRPIGLAILTYERRSPFQPVAADLVEIDAGTGSATARRMRLDVPQE
jgi:predicted phosphodiesterase